MSTSRCETDYGGQYQRNYHEINSPDLCDFSIYVTALCTFWDVISIRMQINLCVESRSLPKLLVVSLLYLFSHSIENIFSGTMGDQYFGNVTFLSIIYTFILFIHKMFH